MALAAAGERTGGGTRIWRSPLLLLLVVVAVLPFFLVARLSVPIGPMYWDLFIYFDAANRIFNGQVPVIDFFVPVGPLGYYLFAGGLKLFPEAQPLLLVDWSLLAVTAPLMALVLWQMEPKHGRAMAFALLLPFLVFALLPFNTREYYPYPGSDGFGIYNRQVCQILYVLVAALVFPRSQRVLAVVVTVAMAALLFTKITGFLAGLLICAFAFLAGRVIWKSALASALAFFAFLGALELWNGFISNYALDIMALVEENADTLLPRFLQAGSHTFGIVAPAGILSLLLLHADRKKLTAEWRDLRSRPSARTLAAVAGHQTFWLWTVLIAGIFFESQNTGSQALIFVWPLLLSICAARLRGLFGQPRLYAAIVILAGAAALPPLVNTIERTARTYVGAVRNLPLEHENLKTLGSVSARPEIMERAEKMIGFYADHRGTYADFVAIGELPSYIFYSEFDFQLAHLMATDRAITDIRALEAKNGIRFDTLMELNFVDPLPYLMGRTSAKHIAIGADPTRAVPDPGSTVEKAVHDVDLVLYPTCPLTTANRDLYQLYAPALGDHIRITLNSCFDAYVNPRFAGRLK